MPRRRLPRVTYRILVFRRCGSHIFVQPKRVAIPSRDGAITLAQQYAEATGAWLAVVSENTNAVVAEYNVPNDAHFDASTEE